jgi:Fic-DOC domain mobile mystery protein B
VARTELTVPTNDLSAREPDGATPLEEEEREGLRPSWIATRADLNEAEQDNLTQARLRLRRRRLTPQHLLDDHFVRQLHREMFGQVWRWAGTYRTTERNIGISPWEIPMAVRSLMADAVFWTTGDQPMPVDDAAVRLHHRLVAIHPFPNGNGRHARELTDLLLQAQKAELFSWGRGSLTDAGATRAAYIAALRSADAHDYEPLLRFVRT